MCPIPFRKRFPIRIFLEYTSPTHTKRSYCHNCTVLPNETVLVYLCCAFQRILSIPAKAS